LVAVVDRCRTLSSAEVIAVVVWPASLILNTEKIKNVKRTLFNLSKMIEFTQNFFVEK